MWNCGSAEVDFNRISCFQRVETSIGLDYRKRTRFVQLVWMLGKLKQCDVRIGGKITKSAFVNVTSMLKVAYLLCTHESSPDVTRRALHALNECSATGKKNRMKKIILDLFDVVRNSAKSSSILRTRRSSVGLRLTAGALHVA